MDYYFYSYWSSFPRSFLYSFEDGEIYGLRGGDLKGDKTDWLTSFILSFEEED